MKKNNNKGGRQKLMAVIAVLIVLAMVLSIVVPIFAAPSVASKEIAYYERQKKTPRQKLPRRTQRCPVRILNWMRKSDLTVCL